MGRRSDARWYIYSPVLPNPGPTDARDPAEAPGVGSSEPGVEKGDDVAAAEQVNAHPVSAVVHGVGAAEGVSVWVEQQQTAVRQKTGGEASIPADVEELLRRRWVTLSGVGVSTRKHAVALAAQRGPRSLPGSPCAAAAVCVTTWPESFSTPTRHA